MMKIFLDSNIWIRPLVEQSSQAQTVTELFQAIDDSLFVPYTSSIVFLEVFYVLKSVYQLKPTQITSVILDLIATKNLTIIEQTYLLKALQLQQKTNIKLSDCLIATQIPKNCTLISFDKDFTKIPDLPIMTPSQILKNV